MGSSTVNCPCCCSACENAEECCVFDGEPVYEPDCEDICSLATEGDDGGYPVPNMFTQTVTTSSSSPNCSTCLETITQEVQGCKDCPCECSWLGEEWQNDPIEDCPPGQKVETTFVTATDVGLEAGNCTGRDCYRCVEKPCSELDCVYDGEPIYDPSCYDYCRWVTFTQTVTTPSTTEGCENCSETITQEVLGCKDCPCECSWLGEEWQNDPIEDCPPGQKVETTFVTATDVGLEAGNCTGRDCYRCVDAACSELPCVYDGVPIYDPPCESYCPYETFTQTVTIPSTTEGCEDCVQTLTQVVCGCNYACPCDCSWKDGGWQSTEPTCGPGFIVEVGSSTSADNPFDCDGQNGCSSTTCYRCVPDNSGPATECCNEDGTCTGFCPFPNCDNNPGEGQTPDGGPCCDSECIDCGDCGDGGAQCCNSVAIQSLFEPLTDESEEMPTGQFVDDLLAYGDPSLATFILEHKLGITESTVKFSILYRAYLLDALAEIAAGGEQYTTLLKHHRRWQSFVNQFRAARFS